MKSGLSCTGRILLLVLVLIAAAVVMVMMVMRVSTRTGVHG